MNGLAVILLIILKSFAGNRTISGAYHIIKGKKTAQTLQDCHLFHVTHLFSINKTVSRDEIDHLKDWLLQRNYIYMIEDDRYLTTDAGNKFIASNLASMPMLKHLNGFVFSDQTELFWQKLALTVQTLSYLLAENRNFYPITKNFTVQKSVKQLLKMVTNKEAFAAQLYEELYSLLAHLPNDAAKLFVIRLSGDLKVGLTNDQAAAYFRIDYESTKLIFQAVIHQMLQIISENRNRYVILQHFVVQAEKETLTDSADKTYNLLKKGFSIEEISTKRKLKKSTIEDHIVEIVMNVNSLSIDQFVSEQKQQQIEAVMIKEKTRRLKLIKSKLGHEISYFEIRLTLARKDI